MTDKWAEWAEWADRLKGQVDRDADGGPVIHAPGPHHSPDDRSLCVWLDEKAEGGFRVHSHATRDSDDFKALKDYVREAVRAPPFEPHKANGHAKPQRRPTAQYVYEDAEGRPVLRVSRYASPKSFAQEKPTGPGAWTWGGIRKDQRVPFRLPEIIEAMALGRTVYVVEGEKSALRLWEFGLAATCSPGGAGKWPENFAKWFDGADVIILPDNDPPGLKHADRVLANLLPVAASAKVINLPNLPVGGDVVDYLDAGGDPLRIETIRPGPPEGADDGAAILDAVHDYIRRFVSYPDLHASVAHALWLAHTYLADRFDVTPRLIFRSPEKASGKTRAMEVSEMLAQRAILVVNVSTSYIFRRVADDEAGVPTLLHDEIDAVFGSKAADHEDLRALINAGYRRGATVGRVVAKGKAFELQEFSAFSPVALAGLGNLPETIMSRAIDVRMRRRLPDEHVDPFRRRDAERAAFPLRKRLEEWAVRIGPMIGETWPELPNGVTDRDADNWEPLVAVADAAGGGWPELARKAAIGFVAHAHEVDGQSLGVRLLHDVRAVFGQLDQMKSAELVAGLNELEDAPWSDLKGKPLDPTKLARLLRQYRVGPHSIRVGDGTPKGYTREDFHDAWARYLAQSPPKPATPATAAAMQVAPTGGSGEG